MKTLLGLTLVALGVWLFHDGWAQRSSLKGRTQAVLVDVVRRVDGETRLPEHSWYMLAGGLCSLSGVGLVFAARRR